jgi:ferrous iron transport protein A
MCRIEGRDSSCAESTEGGSRSWDGRFLAKQARVVEMMDNTEQSGIGLLADLPQGERAVIRVMRGGRVFGLRAASMGFTEGTEVRMVRNQSHGPVIVEVRGSQVALGRGEASKIWVERANTPKKPGRD